MGGGVDRQSPDEGVDSADPGDAAAPMNDADLDAMPLRDRIEYIRWYSETPGTHLFAIADELATQVDALDSEERHAFAALVISLRSAELVDAALRALGDELDNEWVRELVAELVWVQGRMDVADAFIRGELPLLAGQDVELQRRWLGLAVRRGRTALRQVAAVLAGTPALDGLVVEADLGEAIGSSRRRDLAESIASQDRMTDDRARAVVDLLADRIQEGAGFRSQSVPWHVFDAYSISAVTEVVDRAIAAADGGYGYSAIRLGDGEAQVLAGVMPDITGVLGVAEDKEWNELDDDEYVRFRERLTEAVRSADFVGIPDLVQCRYGPVGYSEVAAICLEAGVEPKRIVPGGSDLGWALEISGQVDRLIERCTGIIGPIDPRDLRRIPREAAIEWLSIPGELLYYYEEHTVETSHWSRFEAIVAHDYRPGQVWLVGAGVLGKIYCRAIQRAGAVAVDLGSVLDVWSGRQDTRGTVRGQLWLTRPYLADGR